jgi:death-on-curing protein
MSEPRRVRDGVVLAIHRRQLAQHGGSAGVRDLGLLASALARPQNLFAYAQTPPDLAALAASYAFGLVRNHPFVDGNKRTALVVLRTFLRLNGRDLVATQEEKYRAVLALADGQMSETEFGDWIRQCLEIRSTSAPAEP